MNPSIRSAALRCVAAGASISVLAALAHAGDLNPPVGPVAPTPGPEPRTAVNATNTPPGASSLFRISQPGSYYLAGNVAGVAGKHGVEIASSGVTLDLNGFDLAGVAGSLDGVSVTVANLANIAVVNGSVRNWGEDGVDLRTLSPSNCRVQGVLASGNTGVGIAVGAGNGVSSPGSANAIADCSAFSNTAGGIFSASGAAVTNCSASFNTGPGFSASFSSTLTNCSSFRNTGTGISVYGGCTVVDCSVFQNNAVGIDANSGCTVTGCSVRANTLDGILCFTQCVIRGNTCSSNGLGAGDGAGVHATNADNLIEGNNCTGADRGIDVDAAGNIIIRNVCSGNMVADWDIVASNVYGPIIDRRAPGSAAVVGYAGPGSLGSTDPNANYSY